MAWQVQSYNAAVISHGQRPALCNAFAALARESGEAVGVGVFFFGGVFSLGVFFLGVFLGGFFRCFFLGAFFFFF